MGKYSKIMIGLLVVGLLAGVIVVSSAFADEPKPQTGPQAFATSFISKLAKALGKTEEEVNGAFKQAKVETINEAVQQGKITQAQADKALEQVEKGGPFAGLPLWHKQLPPKAKVMPRVKEMIARGQILKVAADFFGIPPGQLMQSLRQGQSLAEVAQAQGKTRDELKSAIVDNTKQVLDKLVANQKLTQQQADQVLQRLQQNLDQIIDQKHQAPAAGQKPNRPNKPSN